MGAQGKSQSPQEPIIFLRVFQLQLKRKSQLKMQRASRSHDFLWLGNRLKELLMYKFGAFFMRRKISERLKLRPPEKGA